MAVAPMKYITVVGPVEKFDEVMLHAIMNSPFHPENTLRSTAKISVLSSFDDENPYSDPLHRMLELKKQMGFSDIECDSTPFASLGKGALEKTEQFWKSLLDQFTELHEEQEQLSKLISDDKQILLTLEHIAGIDVHLEEFFDLKYAKFRFGRLRREIYDKFITHLDEEKDFFFMPTSIEKDFVYGMVLATRNASEKVDARFAALHFERIRISDRVSGTAEEARQTLQQEIESSEKRLADVTSQLENLKATKKEDFGSALTFLRQYNEAFEMRRFAARSHNSFFLMGWVAADDLDTFMHRFDAFPDVTCNAEDPSGSDEQPPVKLKNHAIFRPFEPYVSMYGLPSYNELDPTPLMAITYTILFGAMFGDVGQGIVLALFGFLLYKFRKMWMGKILVYTGISSTIFGFVYGSVFGYEDLLPYETFKVMEGDNTNRILIVTVLAGTILISVAMIFNIINGIRQKDWIKAFFSPNGIAGFVFYWAVIFCVLPLLGMGGNVVTIWYILLFVAVPLVLIYLKEPLGALAARHKNWKAEDGFGNYLLVSFFELLEVVLSFVTNTISFLRVGAFALNHAGMMMVVFLLAQGTGSSDNIIVVILGNLVVMAIEGLVVSIQVLRLEFYELFGRFYSGEGTPYEPLNRHHGNMKD